MTSKRKYKEHEIYAHKLAIGDRHICCDGGWGWRITCRSRLANKVARLAASCLSGCFSKPQAVVCAQAAPSAPENLAQVPWAATYSRPTLMKSSFAIVGASSLWRRSKPCWDPGPSTSPRPIRRCDLDGPFQATQPRLTTTYWGLLKQPDKHESPTRRSDPLT